jgi:phosphofructokinase-like protein
LARQKRIGILTGGGDCPGLNAAIRATAKTAIKTGYEVIGIHNGWEGFIDDETELLDSIKTSGIIDHGGTILGTSRISPLRIENGPQIVFDRFRKLDLESLVVLGGEGTLSVATHLSNRGLPIIGIPKTIDNDVMETDYTIGFQTAVEIATDALDRLRSTAASHHRVMILEVMGRYTGWIATYAGMANGADAILIPEIPVTAKGIDQLCQMLERRNKKDRSFSIVVVAEGTKLEGIETCQSHDPAALQSRAYRRRDVGTVIGDIIEEKTGLETRVSSLDYIQRGGTPVAYDRNLAIEFGFKASRLANDKRYGYMTALKGNSIIAVPLEKIVNRIKAVNMNVYKVAESFFG